MLKLGQTNSRAVVEVTNLIALFSDEMKSVRWMKSDLH